MNSKSATACIALMFACLVPASAELVRGPGPFIQRINLADFLRLEADLKVDFSDSRDMVIYRTSEVQVIDALTIYREGNIFIVSRESTGCAPAPDGWISEKAQLPAQIAQRVIESVKLLLEYHVLAPPTHHKDLLAGFGRKGWVFLRLSQKEMISGFVSGKTMHSPRGERAEFFTNLLYQLEELCRVDADEREKILTDIDKSTGIFLIEEKKLRGR